MCDFDLSQALDSALELNVKDESCCFDMTDVQDKIFRLDKGLDLVVSRIPNTFYSIANLVLAVNRMKKPPRCSSQELSDEELCSAIMDNVVEETIFKTVVNSSTGQTKMVFLRTNSTTECTLCDHSQKSIVCPSDMQQLKLQAITLKGGYGDYKVNFKLSKYVYNSRNHSDGQVVVLSIKNNDLHISCSMNGDTAVLNLEKCKEDLKEDLKEVSNDDDVARFLFYKRTTGVSLNTFESVKCPGWVISTSDKDASVEMCKVDSAQRSTCFKVNR